MHTQEYQQTNIPTNMNLNLRCVFYLFSFSKQFEAALNLCRSWDLPYPCTDGRAAEIF